MAGRLTRTAPALLPAAAALALFAYWIAEEGGYAPSDWYPGIFLLAGLLVAATVGLGRRRPRLGTAAAVALAALAAYTAWSYASVLWAADQGLALEGSNRTLAFLLAFALFAVLPWHAAGARALAVAFTGVIAVAGAVTAVRLATAAEPVTLFLDARLASPLGYQNADAALWTAGALPALVLAAGRDLPAVPRGLLLAAAGMLTELAILAQSRGWLLTLPVLLLVAVIVVPGRLRFIGAAALTGTAAAFALPALLDVYQAGGSRSRSDAAAAVAAEAPHAAAAILITAGALFAVGTLLALVDRRASPAPPVLRRLRAAAVAACAAGLLAGAAAGWAAAGGDPIGRASEAWDEFRAGEDLPDPGTSNRFGNLGSARYDYWRVALDAFGDRPLGGLGQDNYAAEYVAERQTTHEPRWVHSLELRLAAHTGAVGLLLFVAFLGAVAVAVVRVLRTRGPDARAAGLCVMPLAVWVVAGSVDWLWEYPALSGTALALAGAAVALGNGSPSERSRVPWAAGPLAAAGVAAVALAAAGPPYLAERHVDTASRTWGREPQRALDRLDRAATLFPLSTRPHLVHALIALELDLVPEARRQLAHVLDRTPRDWFAHFELGLIASREGDEAAARRHLAQAHEQNPREPLAAEALERLGTREPLTLAEAHRELLARALRRVGRDPE